MGLLGDFITRRKGELGLSYGQIAERSGLSRQAVQTLASGQPGRTTPRPATLEMLARGLDVPIETLRNLAAQDAGYGEIAPELGELVATASQLDKAGLDALASRARAILNDQGRGEP